MLHYRLRWRCIRGNGAIKGAVDSIAKLRTLGKRIAFLTNNSIQRPEYVREKLCRLGIDCETRDIMTSGCAVARYLSETRVDAGRGVYVIGSDDLSAQIQEQGINLNSAEECGALVVGLDPAFNYSTIHKGLSILLREVPFIVCNRDASYPSNNDDLAPGCGAMVGALEGASLRHPDYEIGKPSAYMLELLMLQIGVSRSECVVFGDTLDSDILMAYRAGIPSVWISGGKMRKTHNPQLNPDLQFESLSEAVKSL